MINGQRIDVDIIDLKAINMLPITLDQIDSIEVVSTPQIIRGEFVEYGLLHFYTSPPHQTLAFSGRYSIGNETGDPGHPIVPGLYRIRELFSRSYDYHFKSGPPQKKTNIEDYRELDKEFSTHLGGLVNEIFNPDDPDTYRENII